MRGRFTRRRWLAAGASLVIIGGLCALILAFLERPSIEGTVRPALDLVAPDGQVFRLASPYGRRHLIVFFLVSCPHCHDALEHLRRLWPHLRSCDIFAVSLSEPTATDHLRSARRFPFPVWTMPPRDALLTMNVRRVPTMLFVAEDGRVDLVRGGAHSFAEDSVLWSRYCAGDAGGLPADLRWNGATASPGGADRN